MSLSAGTRLGPYEIVSAIGAGGMGEVYRARDTRLDRTVAVKILPAEMGSDPERRRRFEQEARSVAALNHPNIVAVYDVGSQQDVAFLVEELIEGESLRALIDRGELTQRKAIALAGQVADGLAAAHQAGIIHRDLKPENIMVSVQGRAKVLDFGLARQSGALGGDAEGRTKTLAVTQEGMVLGTLGYMSPEQVRGKTADARSDIFSLGAVFYEMLSGKRAFHRDTAADTLSAILKEDPADLPESVPPGVRQVVLHCLEKDAAHRFQSAQDLAFAIHALSGSSVSSMPALETAPAKASRGKPWLIAGAVVAAALAGLVIGETLAPASAVDLGKQHHKLLVSEATSMAVPRWAPDGKSFTYTSSSQLLVQSLEAAVPNAIMAARLQDGAMPFFSPDGSRIWYTTSKDNRSVWSIGAAGGDPKLELRDLGPFFGLDGAALSRDGKSLVVAQEVSPGVTTLRVSSPPGSPPQPFPDAPVLKVSYSRVRIRFSHDGRKLLAVFAAPRNPLDAAIWVIPWPPGKGAARKIDVHTRAGEVINSADWLLGDRYIVVDTSNAMGLFNGGTLLLVDSESNAVLPLTPDNAEAAYPSVGPDGRILYVRQHAPYDLVETPVDGGPRRELLATDWIESFGAWSRAADEFAYVSNRAGDSGVWISSVDGSWQRNVVTSKDVGETGRIDFRSPEFSPDGKRICYIAGRRVWISPASGGSATAVTPDDGASALTPTWSPDGKWIAYRTGDTLMKAPVGGGAPPVKIAATMAVPAAWSPDGTWITAGVDGGIGVVSPDGNQKRVLFKRPFESFSALGWSRDSATLFLMEGGPEDPVRLSAVDLKTGSERLIHEYPPDGRFYAEQYVASARLYPSRDGKYLLGSRFSIRSAIWLLEGVETPRSFWQRLLR